MRVRVGFPRGIIRARFGDAHYEGADAHAAWFVTVLALVPPSHMQPHADRHHQPVGDQLEGQRLIDACGWRPPARRLP